uniref:Cerebellar degeneration-related protein 2-like n=1 Tax=Culex pipiens TaxID=7175 RepID=A0A8D8K2Y0_CULPI
MGSVSNETGYEGVLVDENQQFILDDLQLAAELGKTLLERNKELESALKHHQNIIEDQAQEIEYLTKQNGALREVNDSRMKIYEQLEVSIQDLERDKYKLALENQAEKKHVKTLCRNIETLEAKVDELTKTMDDVRRQLDAERKKNERLQSDSLSGNGAGSRVQLRPVAGGDGDDASLSGPDEDEITEIDTSKPENFSFAFRDQSHSTDVTDGSHLGQSFSHQHGHHTNHQLSDLNLAEENEELIRIMQELERTRKCFVAEQNRVAELEEQLAAIAQENQILQSKIVQINTTEEMKSVHEELSILEEVRQGQMCTRCLRGFEDRPDDESIITGTDADDDRSLMDLIQNAASEAGVPSAVYRSSVTIKARPASPPYCSICAHSTKYLHELPVNLIKLLLELWLALVRRFAILKWILKLFQWPALLIYRMISLPSYDQLNLILLLLSQIPWIYRALVQTIRIESWWQSMKHCWRSRGIR